MNTMITNTWIQKFSKHAKSNVQYNVYNYANLLWHISFYCYVLYAFSLNPDSDWLNELVLKIVSSGSVTWSVKCHALRPKLLQRVYICNHLRVNDDAKTDIPVVCSIVILDVTINSVWINILIRTELVQWIGIRHACFQRPDWFLVFAIRP